MYIIAALYKSMDDGYFYLQCAKDTSDGPHESSYWWSKAKYEITSAHRTLIYWETNEAIVIGSLT